MKAQTLFLLVPMFLGSVAANAATCSRMNLTKCLDSVCAINIGANPGARCQYCGAGDSVPETPKNMPMVSVGKSSSTSLSDKELKNAPKVPGERYVWAQAQCLKKIAGCTPDDIEDAYDKLIDQSCTAAGISIQRDNAAAKLNNLQNKTMAQCQTAVQACLVKPNRCGPDYKKCATDADFDQSFAACSVEESAGCDNEFFADIRTQMIADRDEMFAAADAVFESIIAAYQTARQSKLESITKACADNTNRDKCVDHVCATNMPNKCATDFPGEKASAILWCKYYILACERL